MIDYRKRFRLLLGTVLILGIALSFAPVRGVLILPLHVHDADARGEIAYVMADGPATWERLRAAADLYHMHRVKQIYLLNQTRMSGHDFIRKRNVTRVQREIDFLGLHGVPADRIERVEVDADHWLSSRSEAVGLEKMVGDVESLVVVTSSPHTRRSLLCFRRSFDASTKVSVYSASEPSESAETHLPIWIEYGKLAVYWLCA